MAFRQGLEQLGWTEGRNIRIDTLFADRPDQFQARAKDLVALQPDVILAHTTPITVALQRENRTIPIVFVSVSDPVGSRLVTAPRAARRQSDWLFLFESGIVGKWLAMLKELAPRLTRVALVANPRTAPFDYFVRGSAKTAAPSLAIEVTPNPMITGAPISSTRLSLLARVPHSGFVALPESPPLPIASSERLRPDSNYRWFSPLRSFSSQQAVSCHTASISSNSFGRQRRMSTASCAAPIPQTCRCTRRPSTKLLST